MPANGDKTLKVAEPGDCNTFIFKERKKKKSKLLLNYALWKCR